MAGRQPAGRRPDPASGRDGRRIDRGADHGGRPATRHRGRRRSRGPAQRDRAARCLRRLRAAARATGRPAGRPGRPGHRGGGRGQHVQGLGRDLQRAPVGRHRVRHRQGLRRHECPRRRRGRQPRRAGQRLGRRSATRSRSCSIRASTSRSCTSRACRPVPLTFAAHDPERGAIGATLGYPGGGSLTILPAAVAGRYPATGRDIYGQEQVRRQILELRAEIERGDSGGPLVLQGRDGRRCRVRRGPDQPGRRLRPVPGPRSRRPSGPGSADGRPSPRGVPALMPRP